MLIAHTKLLLLIINAGIVGIDKRVKILDFLKWIIPIFLEKHFVKVTKIRHDFVKLHRIVFTKVSLCSQIKGKQNIAFQFSVKLISNNIHKATLKLGITQIPYVDRSH